MNTLKKIISLIVAVLLLTSAFALSAFADSNYNADDLAFVKRLALASENMKADYNVEDEKELVAVAERIGEWRIYSSEKRLVSLNISAAGIEDFTGSVDASELLYISALNLSGNLGIEEIILPKSSNLKEINISGTSVKTLDLSGKGSLVSLSASGVRFDELNLTGCDKIKEISVGSVGKFTDSRGVYIDFTAPKLANMVGMNYKSESNKVTVTYRHPYGDVIFDGLGLPDGADFTTQNLFEDGEAFAETTVWFTLTGNVNLKPDFISNSVEILKLSVDGVEIKPNGAGVYVAEIPYGQVEIDVDVVTEGRATVEGAGKLSLKDGENFFTIKVTSADGNDVKEYTLKITRFEPSLKQNKKSTLITVIVVVLAVIAVIGAMFAVFYFKKKKRK